MLIGNYSVYSKLPLKYCTGPGSATAGGFGAQSNYVESGRVRSRMMQDMTTVALQQYALPNGGYPSLTWFIPQKVGAIGSSNQIFGSGTPTLNLAGGVNAVASLTGSGTITNAAAELLLQLVASISGSGSITSATLNGLLQAIAGLSGSGSLTGTITAALLINAALTGSGTISNAASTAVASLSSDVTGTGGVTTANMQLIAQLLAGLVGNGTVSSANANASSYKFCR